MKQTYNRFPLGDLPRRMDGTIATEPCRKCGGPTKYIEGMGAGVVWCDKCDPLPASPSPAAGVENCVALSGTSQRASRSSTTVGEPGTRERVIRMLWEKQFEGSPWATQFHLIRPESLDADYGVLADRIIAAVEGDIRECFTLIDRRQPAVSVIPQTSAAPNEGSLKQTAEEDYCGECDDERRIYEDVDGPYPCVMCRPDEYKTAKELERVLLKRAGIKQTAGEWPSEEEIARLLVPFSFGAFEDQRTDDNGKRLVPAFTPNDHARRAAQRILASLPHSEGASGGLLARLRAKAAQLEAYRADMKDRESAVNQHADTVAFGRLQQIQQIIGWLSEDASFHSLTTNSEAKP